MNIYIFKDSVQSLEPVSTKLMLSKLLYEIRVGNHAISGTQQQLTRERKVRSVQSASECKDEM